MFESVTSNVIAAVIVYVLGALTIFGVTRIRHHSSDALTRLTGLAHSGATHYLVYGLVDDKTKPGNRYVEEGDVSAIAASVLLMESLTKPGNIRLSNSSAALPYFSEWIRLLSISGPIWNEVSRSLIDSSGFPAKFSSRNNGGQVEDTLVFTPQGQVTVEVATRYIQGVPRECYAMVLTLIRPIHLSDGWRRQKAIAVCGISTLGTFGGIHWLRCLSGQKWSDIFDSPYQKSLNRCVILHVRDHSPDGFFSYASQSSAPPFIEVDIVTLFESPSDTGNMTFLGRRAVRSALNRIRGEHD